MSNNPKAWEFDFEDNDVCVRDHFSNDREAFCIIVAGVKLYIITSPREMSLVYRNTTSLSFDEFIRDLHVAFEMSSDGQNAMWNNSQGKCLIHVAHDLHVAQLHPGEQLNDLTNKFLDQIATRLSWDSLLENNRETSRSSEQISLSLYEWCVGVLIPAASVAFFGESLLRIDKSLIEDFRAFDEDSWMLTYRYPRVLARKMYRGKDRNTRTFTRYYALPPNERSGACFYVRSLEARQRAVGMTDRDIAISTQLFYWV